MSSNTKLADDYPDIARRLKEIEAERWKQLQETKLPETEADYTGVYAYTGVDYFG